MIESTTDGGKTWADVKPSDIRIREVDSTSASTMITSIFSRVIKARAPSTISTYTEGQCWQVLADRTAQLRILKIHPRRNGVTLGIVGEPTRQNWRQQP